MAESSDAGWRGRIWLRLTIAACLLIAGLGLTILALWLGEMLWADAPPSANNPGPGGGDGDGSTAPGPGDDSVALEPTAIITAVSGLISSIGGLIGAVTGLLALRRTRTAPQRSTVAQRDSD